MYFKTFEKKCVETYELDPAQFLSASGLALRAYLKKAEIKLKLLTDTDMLQIAEKGVRCGICYATHWYAEANNKYMKNYKKDKESSYLMYWDAKNLCGWKMSQKLPVDNF